MIDAPLQDPEASLMGNRVLMRTSSRTSSKASSGRVVRTAGVLVVLAAIAAGGSYWVSRVSQPPLMSSPPPPAAVEPAFTAAPAPAPTRKPSRSRRHRRGPSILVRNQHRVAVLDSARADPAAEMGADVSATAPTALAPRIVFSADPAPTPPAAAPSTPVLTPPPVTPALKSP